ncbi:MAG: hypothetical protein LWX08_14905 [Deltaproteobacteria bacterium]|jgi:hypothetical protein|nr:hypothetical protein [Deltaproteobacteria bacterium]
MKVFRAVADSRCLIGLAQIELFALLRDLAIEMGFFIDKEKSVKRLREVGFRLSDKLYRKMFSDSK